MRNIATGGYYCCLIFGDWNQPVSDHWKSVRMGADWIVLTILTRRSDRLEIQKVLKGGI